MEPRVTVRSGREVDSAELLFLIARSLDGGPCQEAAKVLRHELTEKGLLPSRKNWLGEDVPLSYEQAVSAAPHVSTEHLAQICSALQELLRSHGHLRLPSLTSLLGSSITSHITGTHTNTRGTVSVLQCVSQLKELSAASRRQLIVNQCQLLCARTIAPSFSPSLFTGPTCLQSFKQHCSMLGHLAPVYCVMFDKSGQRIITGADDDLLKVWSSDQCQLLATLRGHAAEVTDMSLSPDNTLIASGSLDKTVRVWCAQSSATLSVLTGHTGPITSVQFSPCPSEEHRLLASTTKDGFVYFWLWNIESALFYNTPIKYMEKNRVGDQTLCSAFSPGGKYFATGGTDKIIRIYVCIPGPPALVHEVSGHMDRIMTIQFCHLTDSVFATGSCDATGRVWRYKEGVWQGKPLTVDPQEIAKMMAEWGKDKPQVTMIGWECTDTYVVTAFSPDCHVRVYHSLSCSLLHTLRAHKGEVFVVEPHPSDSRILLSAGHDGLIVLWDMLSGSEVNRFQLQHEDEPGVPCIFDCRFSPSGSLCAAADGNGYLSILGLGSSLPYQMPPTEQFFHTDYRPLMRDRQHFVVDEQSQRPPHLLPPPYLVDIDGHAHPARHQEALLRQMRPVKQVKPDSAAEEMEDYDEVMRERLSQMMLGGGQFRSARSAMALREGAGGRERERRDGFSGSGQSLFEQTSQEESGQGSEVIAMANSAQSEPPSQLSNSNRNSGSPPPAPGEPTNNQHSGFGGPPPPAHEEPSNDQQSGSSGPPPLAPGEPTIDQKSGSSCPTPPTHGEPTNDQQSGSSGPPPPASGEPSNDQQGGSSSLPPPAPGEPTNDRQSGSSPDEPTVDVTTMQQGRDQLVQNMLSSVVYSLGLSEEEEIQYLSHWHSRTIVPLLDSSALAWAEARWRDLYEREQLTYDEENKKMVVQTPSSPVPVATEGRSLRSGRTLPDPSDPLDSSLVEPESERESDRDSNAEEEDGDMWVDNESTASSDISDWTREEGVLFLSPGRKRRRRLRKKQISSSEEPATSAEEEDEEDEEGEVGEGDGEGEGEGDPDEDKVEKKRPRAAAERAEKERKRKKPRKPPPVRSVLDYTAYHPPDWLKTTSPDSAPYFPQVGDIVVYFYQGHDLYVKAVKEERLFPWKPQKMPWQRYHLLPRELCQVKNIHFVVGPPTLCSISLTLLASPSVDGPSTSKASSEKITFTFKYHDMDNVLEFIILESVYKKSIKRVWSEGSRFRSKIDGMYWYGTVLGQEPFSADVPSSVWQCYRVKWDDGATDQLSPWDMEPIGREQNEEEEEGEREGEKEGTGGWLDSEGEAERILRGLEVVGELDEAAMFQEPVDLEEIVDYCSRVPFPTDLSTIRTRLQNRFYRRKISLLWEVVQIRRNAELYNEEGSLIVSHARILSNTLCKFITSSSSDPLEFYQTEGEGDEQEVEKDEDVAVPDVVEFVDNGILPPLSPSHHQRHLSTPTLSSDTVEDETEGPLQPWYQHAEELLEKLQDNENSSPFLHPVDTAIYTDYCDVVREPMDFSKITRRLRNGHYIIPNDIITDIRLIFANSRVYNGKGTLVYKMTTELHSFFESNLLNFLKACGGESSEGPLHGTRHALGRLAHHNISEEIPMATQVSTTPIEAHPPRRSLRRRGLRPDLRPLESDSDSIGSEQSSADVSAPLTPASESSMATRSRHKEREESHGMTLRERYPAKPVKRVFEDSDTEEEGEGEGDGGEDGRLVTTRSRSSIKKQRLSSDSEGEEPGVAMVTRTSRGRIVKPIHKFS